VRQVGVVGSSARAAVHSLARAGFSAWAVDQFADRDLKRFAVCTVCLHDDYPTGIPALAAQFPPGPVLYTGGLENHPQIVAELGDQRELWGNPPEVLARVRDPFALFPALAEAGFTTPRIVPRGLPCPSEGRWLRKPLRSGGGTGIRFAQPGEAASHDHVFQEFIDGQPMSALFVNAALIGITEQLIGEPWLHARPFTYCGNIGPCRVPDSVTHTLSELGRTLAGWAGLRGVWGLDFALRGESPHPLEVNPRYTASAEVLEHTTGIALFREDLPPQPPSLKGGGSRIYSPLPSGRGAGGVGAEPTPNPSLKGGEQDIRSSNASRESEEAPRAFTPLPSGRGAGGGGVIPSSAKPSTTPRMPSAFRKAALGTRTSRARSTRGDCRSSRTFPRLRA